MELKTYLSWITGMTAVMGSLVVATLLITNPTAIGPVGVTLWFIALFLTLQGAATLGLFALKRGSYEAIGPHQRLTASSRQGFLISAITTVSLALSSLRQLSTRDFWLMLALAVLIELFFKARR